MTDLADLRKSQGLRYLVTLEAPQYPAERTAPVAGIYVQALDAEDAVNQVREYLDQCTLVPWRK